MVLAWKRLTSDEVGKHKSGLCIQDIIVKSSKAFKYALQYQLCYY